MTLAAAGGPGGQAPPDARPARIDGAQSNAVSGQDAQQLASLAGAVTTLAASTEDEQDDAAAYVATGRPAGALSKLMYQAQQSIVTHDVSQLVSLARRTGQGLPPQVHTALSAALNRVAELTVMRRDVIQTQAAALEVIEEYSMTCSILVAFNAEIAWGSGDAVFVRDVYALTALQRAEDARAQERAILDAALTRGQFQPGEQAALSLANEQEQSDLSVFISAATPAQQQDYQKTVTGPQVKGAQQILAQALAEGQNSSLSLKKPPGPAFFTVLTSWHVYMTTMLGQMRVVERYLLAAIMARTQALQQQTTRTILETWLKIAVVVLAVMAFAVGVRRRRRSSRFAVG